jgi:predicted metalloprotease with PDZ domain
MPTLQSAFGQMPPKILLVGAGEPMWRGALSAPNSIFLHADRPLVSENGTSTLVHELVHVITRIRGRAPEDDWIAEGLAVFYAIVLMHRAGGLTDARRAIVRESLRRWSAPVKTLRTRGSKGPTTARAALWFETLDAEIRKASGGKRSLDEVVQELMQPREVGLAELRASAQKAAGGKLKAFDSALLR